MNSVVRFFDPLRVQGQVHRLDHLVAFGHDLIGHGRDKSNLRVRVSFQSHVFSKSCAAGDRHDFLDEGRRARVLCPDRYGASLGLPLLCRRMLNENFLTWESEDKNGKSNMAVIDGPLVSGNHQVVLYYVFPSRADGIDVELVVKSAYEKAINFIHIKRRLNVLQVIKTCHFKQVMVPK